MKYLAVLFIIAIAATTLVSSNAVLNEEERQTCNSTSLMNAAKAFSTCGPIFASACANSRGDFCSCCRNILGGSSSASGYRCCVAFQDYVKVAASCVGQAGIPSTIRNCKLGSGAATTTISYFTGLLLLLTAVTYQFLFWGPQKKSFFKCCKHRLRKIRDIS